MLTKSVDKIKPCQMLNDRAMLEVKNIIHNILLYQMEIAISTNLYYFF